MRSHLSCLITSTPRYTENTTRRVTGRDTAAVVPPSNGGYRALDLN